MPVLQFHPLHPACRKEGVPSSYTKKNRVYDAVHLSKVIPLNTENKPSEYKKLAEKVNKKQAVWAYSLLHHKNSGFLSLPHNNTILFKYP